MDFRDYEIAAFVFFMSISMLARLLETGIFHAEPPQNDSENVSNSDYVNYPVYVNNRKNPELFNQLKDLSDVYFTYHSKNGVTLIRRVKR